MSNVNFLQQMEPILKYYEVKPHFIERFGKIYRVYSDKGVFALKKISPKHGTDFIRHIQYLYQKGYNRIVPVYPTVDGRYAVLHNQALYYLMPWLPNEEKENRNERNQQLFRELARLHTLSLHEVSIDPKEKEDHYNNLSSLWEKEIEFIEGYIEACEGKQYMSPTELLFCLYYNDIRQALTYSQNKLKEWFEQTKEETKARAVVVHGKISSEHFLYDDRGYGYFINLEGSKEGAAIHDILPFLSRLLHTFPKRCDDCIDWLYVYLKYFPLKDDEMLLLLSYFAHPGPVLRVVEEYYKSKDRNEIKFVQKLQKQYWLLKNSEYMVMRIEEIERQKKQAAAQAAAQSNEGAQS
ncbi:spore coat protein YsxE [Robertmurraya korlensis]|uniref:spore coat protein YsxE n=1 Tax=Robertmurraya korlensis TaxID=519977 RepID=UPI0012ED71F8|nr:spore coat protein YsxE [Robertmurraya korlensis]